MREFPWRGYLRLGGFVPLAAWHILLCGLMGLLFPRKPERAWREASTWARRAARLLGIEIEYQGSYPASGTLILPNHRSYADVVPFMLGHRTCFVAKKEVASWPLIGAGVRVVGTILVNRSDKESRKDTRLQVRDRLRQGLSVVVFPEGTTYQAPQVGELHRGIFEAAADGQIRLVPVALEYECPSDAWTGKATFLPHFLTTFHKPKTRIKIRFGQSYQGKDGEELRALATEWLQRNAADLQSSWQAYRQS